MPAGVAPAGTGLALRPSFASETPAEAWGREGGNGRGNDARPALPAGVGRAEDAKELRPTVRIVPLSGLDLSSHLNDGAGCPNSQPKRATASTADLSRTHFGGRARGIGLVRLGTPLFLAHAQAQTWPGQAIRQMTPDDRPGLPGSDQ